MRKIKMADATPAAPENPVNETLTILNLQEAIKNAVWGVENAFFKENETFIVPSEVSIERNPDFLE